MLAAFRPVALVPVETCYHRFHQQAITHLYTQTQFIPIFSQGEARCALLDSRDSKESWKNSDLKSMTCLFKSYLLAREKLLDGDIPVAATGSDEANDEIGAYFEEEGE